MRINYDFSDLEAFLAVKETGSFHLAADKLNLSQSAVTRRIKKLEEALDTQLFERTTRAVKPTLAAKRLQARAEAMLDGAKETTFAMRDESATFGYQKSAIVTVGLIPSVAAALLPAALRRFRAAGQTARVRLLDGNANEVAEAVANGEADFGIASIPMLEPSTTFDVLFDDRIGLAMPPSHPFATKDAVAWSDLADQDLIVPVRGTGNRLLIDEALARSGRPIGWTYEVGRSTTALKMVSEGIGVAILPLSSASYAVVRSVIMRPMISPGIARPVGLLSKIGQLETKTVTALKLIILETTKQVAAQVSQQD